MAVSVKLDDDMKDRIQSLAESKRRSAHWIMREAIQEYVSREEARRSFIADAEESWRHFQETGLHVTGEEMDAWLSSWGTDEELDAPECHT
ncbi:CopG family ribbon-helix-helix protein [uncultured Devosia sp.]|uniref:CopG family ribbon-helix-helix protein n=1 Tax=uncultured Devosia sp. TaxID=211434 RepID=UPI0035CB792D